ncbi:MAG: hypothetical protein ACKOQ6_02900 [Bacteroidota bacterium]
MQYCSAVASFAGEPGGGQLAGVTGGLTGGLTGVTAGVTELVTTESE